jgi:DNA-binding NtrC family response regulator
MHVHTKFLRLRKPVSLGDHILTTKIREERPDIRVIVISGQTNADILVGNRLDAFLPKPFQPVTLLKAVQDILDGRDAATVDH